MKLMIRAHDLGVKGEKNIISRLDELGLDGVQLVVYKSMEDVPYAKEGHCGISSDRAFSIGDAFREAGKDVALIGAYFNPVHPNTEKALLGKTVFKEYLQIAYALGSDYVGTETGSCMGDPWGYHPDNRKTQAFLTDFSTFCELADWAGRFGTTLALEGAFNHVCYSPDALYMMVRAISRPNVKVIFDLYNYLDISNYTEAYSILDRTHELFGDGILLYHLKDFTVSDGKLCQCAVGKGILDYERIIKSIYSVNKDATLVFEGTVGDDIPESVAFIRSIIASVSRDLSRK